MALHLEGDGVPLLELRLELPDAQAQLLDLGREPWSGSPPGSVRKDGRSAFADQRRERGRRRGSLGVLPVHGRRKLVELVERLEGRR